MKSSLTGFLRWLLFKGGRNELFFLLVGDTGGLLPLDCMDAPLSIAPEVGSTDAPISLAASVADSVFGLLVRLAFCTLTAEVGEGGRGGGFIDCATDSGIVLMLLDDVTGAGIHRRR